MSHYILAIDQGTTSSRAILFDEKLAIKSVAQKQLKQHFPRSGWVEHDPQDLWNSVLSTCRKVIEKSRLDPQQIAAIGITNQRETSLLWDRETGKPLHRAIVWQDRRTAKRCDKLKNEGFEKEVTKRTGLVLDPYFSASKIKWMLDHVEGAREAAKAGRLAFGTVDSYLLWRLTGGRVHATDATNASRTSLYNIHKGAWDKDMCKLFEVPPSLLPQVKDCAASFGLCDPSLLGAAIPITGIAGDQHAATIGQACFAPGMMKATYGTGGFALLNTGKKPVRSRNRLLTTLAFQLDGQPTYALEGSFFIAGAGVQWLRDGLGMIDDATQSGEMARQADPHQNVILVPAFVGLGAPHWDADCRGTMFGLTRATGPNEFARAALDAVCYQTQDLLHAMHEDYTTGEQTILRVDGGMAASNWTMQRLADLTGAPVDRPPVLETTALGVAWLAGMQRGLCPGPREFATEWNKERRFSPHMPEAERKTLYEGWQDAVRHTLSP